MAKFKFLDNFFSFFLPQYYKDEDTYKDINGKGILERFCEVCSEYFDDDVMPDIDNFMDILDVDLTHPLFLNYLWEYLGEIPYAYGVLIRGTPFTEEDMEQWITEDRPYPTVDPREVLRYAIPLYKIRCTSQFYEVLGRLYNITIDVEEPTGPRPPSGQTTSTVWDVRYDSEYYDSERARYDYTTDCLDCVTIKVGITVDLSDLVKWESDGNWEKVQQALVNLINKYLPLNVNPLTVETVIWNGEEQP